ncbi:S1/P1 Nuclease [Brevundimonas diminuta]|uniref:S1/P1 Nuclease n=1 Tax=Brevundimonas TaxID=41275 RepID=UPI002097A97F|nr:MULTISPECIES: S1/P1 Nuclease [Brevundimonas]MCO8028876.1 S1/P1 Nuclease [Brevundimonas diminuta]
MNRQVKRLMISAAALMLVAAPAVQVEAWGSSGHRVIGVAAMRHLPGDLPAFLRTAGAAADVGEYSREPDRWKGAGQPHDRERDTAHFVDMDDQGRVMDARGMTMADLPRLKSEYDAALIRAGLDVDKAGYLPYAIMDAWQNLERDFAYWRVLSAAEAREPDLAKQAWYRADRQRREQLILRDIGVLSHFVGDAAQPHHTTIHFNGWAGETNPERFTTSRRTHGDFEGAFTSRTLRQDAVEAAMIPMSIEGFDVRARTASHLNATLATVIPFYRMEKAGAFKDTDPRGAVFVTERLAAGASELRDFVSAAWRVSASSSIGWPAVKVAEVEAGRVDPWTSMVGED